MSCVISTAGGGSSVGGSVLFGDFFSSQPLGDLHLSTTDGDSGHSTPMLAGQVACGAANPTPDVEDGGAWCELGNLEEEVDQVGLADFFGVCGRLEVCMVDVLAPMEKEGVRC